MDSISVIKPDMAVLGLKTLGLSPFGVLSQLFTMELCRRAGQDVTPLIPMELTLLDEGGEDEEQSAGGAKLDLSLELVIRRLSETVIRREIDRYTKSAARGSAVPGPSAPRQAREGGISEKDAPKLSAQELERVILRSVRVHGAAGRGAARNDIRTVDLVAPTLGAAAQPSAFELPQTYSSLVMARLGENRGMSSHLRTESGSPGRMSAADAGFSPREHSRALKADSAAKTSALRGGAAASVPATGGWDVVWREEHPGFSQKPPLREAELKPSRSILLPDVLRERRAEAVRLHESAPERETYAGLEYAQSAAEAAFDTDNRITGSVPVTVDARHGMPEAGAAEARQSAGMLPGFAAEREAEPRSDATKDASGANRGVSAGAAAQASLPGEMEEYPAGARAVPAYGETPESAHAAETEYRAADEPVRENTESAVSTREAVSRAANAGRAPRTGAEGSAAEPVAEETAPRSGDVSAIYGVSSMPEAESEPRFAAARAVPAEAGLRAEEPPAETEYRVGGEAAAGAVRGEDAAFAAPGANVAGAAANRRSGSDSAAVARAEDATQKAETQRTEAQGEETKKPEAQFKAIQATEAQRTEARNAEVHGLEAREAGTVSLARLAESAESGVAPETYTGDGGDESSPAALAVPVGGERAEPPAETAYYEQGGYSQYPLQRTGEAPSQGAPSTARRYESTAQNNGAIRAESGGAYPDRGRSGAGVGMTAEGKRAETAGVTAADKRGEYAYVTAAGKHTEYTDISAPQPRGEDAAAAGSLRYGEERAYEEAYEKAYNEAYGEAVAQALPADGVTAGLAGPVETAYLTEGNAPAHTAEAGAGTTAPRTRSAEDGVPGARLEGVRTAEASLENKERIPGRTGTESAARDSAAGAARSLLTAPPVIGRTLTGGIKTALQDAETVTEHYRAAARALPVQRGEAAAANSGEPTLPLSADAGSALELTYTENRAEAEEAAAEERAPEWVQRLLERTGKTQSAAADGSISWKADPTATWSAPYSIPKTGLTEAAGMTASPVLPFAAPAVPGETVFKDVQQGGAERETPRMSDAELRRTADRIYAMIEERLRKELRRSGK